MQLILIALFSSSLLWMPYELRFSRRSLPVASVSRIFTGNSALMLPSARVSCRVSERKGSPFRHCHYTASYSGSRPRPRGRSERVA